ncbi:DoxX family protein [Pseudooctadecabacter sp.]|uniref:DoxX family protein n=1 Tax=Pseudooctadecabacter sp. TaxID=1966338 RepID=UPI0035C7F237
MENRWDAALVATARMLIAVLFVGGAVQKVQDAAPAMALLADRGLPEVLVWPAMVFNGVIGVALIAGWQLRTVALAAGVYSAATSLFHLQPDDPWQMTIFVKNWAIAGGCLALAVCGGLRGRA